MFVSLVFEIQRRQGRHAHVEHPWGSRAWSTKAFNRLNGSAVKVDQCQYGEDGRTRWQGWAGAKEDLLHDDEEQDVLLQCPGNHNHVYLEGNIPGHGPRSSMAENYPPDLAKKLAELMLADEEPEEIYPVEEDPSQEKVPEEDADNDPVYANKKLRREVGNQAANYIVRLHKNLGHPSAEVLLRMLEEVQATKSVLQAAKEYVCPACYACHRPAGVLPRLDCQRDTSTTGSWPTQHGWTPRTAGNAC